jgi:hypothetical protein
MDATDRLIRWSAVVSAAYVALGIVLLTMVASRSAHAFALVQMDEVDAQGVLISSVVPANMNQAPRWDDLPLSTGLTYGIGNIGSFQFSDGTTAQQLTNGIASVFNIWATADSALSFAQGNVGSSTNFDFGLCATSCTLTSLVNPNISNINGNDIDILAANLGGKYGALTVPFGTEFPVHLTTGFSTDPPGAGLFPSWQLVDCND